MTESTQQIGYKVRYIVNSLHDDFMFAQVLLRSPECYSGDTVLI